MDKLEKHKQFEPDWQLLHLLHQVPEVLRAVEISLDEDNGQVLAISDAACEDVHLAPAAHPGRVLELHVPHAPG